MSFLDTKIMQIVMIIFLNIGSGYLSSDIKSVLEVLFSYSFMKFVVLFALCYTQTRDPLLSVVVGLVGIIFIKGFLNVDSSICFFTENMKSKIENFNKNEKKINL